VCAFLISLYGRKGRKPKNRKITKRKLKKSIKLIERNAKKICRTAVKRGNDGSGNEFGRN